MDIYSVGWTTNLDWTNHDVNRSRAGFGSDPHPPLLYLTMFINFIPIDDYDIFLFELHSLTFNGLHPILF